MRELPAGWTWTQIGSILSPLSDGRTIHQGWSPQCEKLPRANDSDWGVLKTTAIQPGVFVSSQHKRLPDDLQPRQLLEVQAGDLVITSAGPRARCGVACLVRTTPGRLMLSGKMYRFRVDQRVAEASYVEAYLLGAEAGRAIDAMKTGISDSGLNLTHKRFRELRIPLPPLAEQRRIVAAIEEHFSRLDAAADSGGAALKRLDSIYEAIYGRATAGDWPRRSLGSMLREPLRNGVSARTSPMGTTRIVTLSAVTQDAFAEANSKLADVGTDRVRDLWLEPGDVLIERSNTPELVGTAALYDGPRNWAIFPDLLIRVRTTDELTPEFLALFLKSRVARRYFCSAAKGLSGSMPKIGQSDIRELLVPLPSREEQEAAVAEAEQMLALASALRSAVMAALKRAHSLRHSILAAAFRGKLIPQDPNDEPASILLERLAAERAAPPKPQRKRRERATA